MKANPIYFDKAFKNESRYLILYGGAGSGKSFFAAQKLLYRLTNETKQKHRFLIVRKVAKTIRNSAYKLLKDIIIQIGKYNGFIFKDNELTIISKKTGSEIISAGVDDAEKLKSIQGITGIWIEEATELTEEDFRQVDLRLRGEIKGYKQIILTFNPISALHWLNNIALPDSYTLKTTYLDNRFIDDDYKRTLENLKHQDINYYNIYARGEWGALQEIIYSNIEIIQEYPEDFNEVIYGLDFGFNNETALIEVGIKDKEYFLTEKLYQNRLTNSELITKLNYLIPNKNCVIYGDAAEPQRIEEISKAGFNIYPADKSVKAGIDFCKSKKIFSRPENVNLNKELNSYSWKKDKNGNVIDEPVKFNDHLCDAFRYALYTHSNTYEPSIKII